MPITEIHMLMLSGTITNLDGKETTINGGYCTASAENPPTEEEVHIAIAGWMKQAGAYSYTGAYQVVRQEKSEVGDPVPIGCSNPIDPVWSVPEPEPEPEPPADP